MYDPDSEPVFGYPPVVFSETKDKKSSNWNKIAKLMSITTKEPPKGLDIKAMLYLK